VREDAPVPFTLVSFHAHPDDEVLYTGGTLARVAAEGHRVVLVTATAGEAGLTSRQVHDRGSLAQTRVAELHRSAAALGVARVVVLGYPDSGLGADPTVAVRPARFRDVEVDAVAARLAEILREERADVLTVYDAAGGYGHPDHVHVHRAGVRAAELAGTPVVLEATVDRDLIRRVLRLLERLPGLPEGFTASAADGRYTARADLTHRVDVRRFCAAKRAAMAAHSSQTRADSGTRTLALLLRLPRPVFRRVLGREWFAERGRRPGELLDDVFASLRG
jgi:LmbE family N-acetylglucosaminyl deacetylase